MFGVTNVHEDADVREELAYREYVRTSREIGLLQKYENLVSQYRGENAIKDVGVARVVRDANTINGRPFVLCEERIAGNFTACRTPYRNETSQELSKLYVGLGLPAEFFRFRTTVVWEPGGDVKTVEDSVDWRNLKQKHAPIKCQPGTRLFSIFVPDEDFDFSVSTRFETGEINAVSHKAGVKIDASSLRKLSFGCDATPPVKETCYGPDLSNGATNSALDDVGAFCSALPKLLVYLCLVYEWFVKPERHGSAAEGGGITIYGHGLMLIRLKGMTRPVLVYVMIGDFSRFLLASRPIFLGTGLALLGAIGICWDKVTGEVVQTHRLTTCTAEVEFDVLDANALTGEEFDHCESECIPIDEEKERLVNLFGRGFDAYSAAKRGYNANRKKDDDFDYGVHAITHIPTRTDKCIDCLISAIRKIAREGFASSTLVDGSELQWAVDNLLLVVDTDGVWSKQRAYLCSSDFSVKLPIGWKGETAYCLLVDHIKPCPLVVGATGKSESSELFQATLKNFRGICGHHPTLVRVDNGSGFEWAHDSVVKLKEFPGREITSKGVKDTNPEFVRCKRYAKNTGRVNAVQQLIMRKFRAHSSCSNFPMKYWPLLFDFVMLHFYYFGNGASDEAPVALYSPMNTAGRDHVIRNLCVFWSICVGLPCRTRNSTEEKYFAAAFIAEGRYVGQAVDGCAMLMEEKTEKIYFCASVTVTFCPATVQKTVPRTLYEMGESIPKTDYFFQDGARQPNEIYELISTGKVATLPKGIGNIPVENFAVLVVNRTADSFLVGRDPRQDPNILDLPQVKTDGVEPELVGSMLLRQIGMKLVTDRTTSRIGSISFDRLSIREIAEVVNVHAEDTVAIEKSPYEADDLLDVQWVNAQKIRENIQFFSGSAIAVAGLDFVEKGKAAVTTSSIALLEKYSTHNYTEPPQLVLPFHLYHSAAGILEQMGATVSFVGQSTVIDRVPYELSGFAPNLYLELHDSIDTALAEVCGYYEGDVDEGLWRLQSTNEPLLLSHNRIWRTSTYQSGIEYEMHAYAPQEFSRFTEWNGEVPRVCEKSICHMTDDEMLRQGQEVGHFLAVAKRALLGDEDEAVDDELNGLFECGCIEPLSEDSEYAQLYGERPRAYGDMLLKDKTKIVEGKTIKFTKARGLIWSNKLPRTLEGVAEYCPGLKGSAATPSPMVVVLFLSWLAYLCYALISVDESKAFMQRSYRHRDDRYGWLSDKVPYPVVLFKVRGVFRAFVVKSYLNGLDSGPKSYEDEKKDKWPKWGLCSLMADCAGWVGAQLMPVGEKTQAFRAQLGEERHGELTRDLLAESGLDFSSGLEAGHSHVPTFVNSPQIAGTKGKGLSVGWVDDIMAHATSSLSIFIKHWLSLPRFKEGDRICYILCLRVGSSRIYLLMTLVLWAGREVVIVPSLNFVSVSQLMYLTKLRSLRESLGIRKGGTVREPLPSTFAEMRKQGNEEEEPSEEIRHQRFKLTGLTQYIAITAEHLTYMLKKAAGGKPAPSNLSIQQHMYRYVCCHPFIREVSRLTMCDQYEQTRRGAVDPVETNALWVEVDASNGEHSSLSSYGFWNGVTLSGRGRSMPVWSEAADGESLVISEGIQDVETMKWLDAETNLHEEGLHEFEGVRTDNQPIAEVYNTLGTKPKSRKFVASEYKARAHVVNKVHQGQPRYLSRIKGPENVSNVGTKTNAFSSKENGHFLQRKLGIRVVPEAAGEESYAKLEEVGQKIGSIFDNILEESYSSYFGGPPGIAVLARYNWARAFAHHKELRQSDLLKQLPIIEVDIARSYTPVVDEIRRQCGEDWSKAL